MAAHLDWHFRHSKRKRDFKRQECRPWYATPEDFMTELTIETTAQIFPQVEVLTTTVSKIHAPDSEVSCSVCNELLSKVYDDEMEEWVMISVVKNGNQVNFIVM